MGILQTVLTDARIDARLSFDQAAELSGLSLNHLRRMEKGRVRPTLAVWNLYRARLDGLLDPSLQRLVDSTRSALDT